VTDPREHERSNVFLGAALHAAGKSIPVRVRNLSIAGALLDGADLPVQGVKVELRRGSLSASGEVAWAAGTQRGIRFDQEIDVSAWVRSIGHAGQRRVDLAVNSLRLGTRRASTAPSEGGISRDVESLESLSEQIQEVTERLASFPDVTVEIAEQLLKLDAIAHVLLRLAKR
jgi:hypothetical protein